MARTTPTLVREALNSDAVEHPSDDLKFHIDVAHRLVERRCAPYTSDEDGLTDTETYVAASLAVGGRNGDQRYSSIRSESAQVSFDWDATRDLTGPAASLWETAVLVDPSGRLDDPADDTMWAVSFGGGDGGDRRETDPGPSPL